MEAESREKPFRRKAMYACTINPKFSALGSGAHRSGKMKSAFGESLKQGPDLKSQSNGGLNLSSGTGEQRVGVKCLF